MKRPVSSTSLKLVVLYQTQVLLYCIFFSIMHVHLKLCAIGILVKTHFLKDLNLALMHDYISTRTCDHNSYAVINFLQFPAVFGVFFKTTSPIYTELDTKLFLMKCGAFNGRTREIE